MHHYIILYAMRMSNGVLDRLLDGASAPWSHPLRVNIASAHAQRESHISLTRPSGVSVSASNIPVRGVCRRAAECVRKLRQIIYC